MDGEWIVYSIPFVRKPTNSITWCWLIVFSRYISLLTNNVRLFIFSYPLSSHCCILGDILVSQSSHGENYLMGS